jgi:hypothetical protein
MTPSEAERRLRLLEDTALARHPEPDPPATDLDRWAASLSTNALMRVEQLFRTMAADTERGDHPITTFDQRLIECACLDADHGDADPVRRSYLSSQPHDPSAPEMAVLRAQIERWVADPDRRYLGGVDASGFLRWHSIAIDALSAGELVRLAALLKVFEDHPSEAAAMQSDALWAVVGRDGQRKLHGMA